MIVPGSNLLNLAHSLIAKQTFVIRSFSGKTLNAAGKYVVNYTDSDPVSGSVQPVRRAVYNSMGLSFAKKYIRIWVSDDLELLRRGTASDRIVYDGRVWELMDENDWSKSDGWDGVIAVEVSNG